MTLANELPSERTNFIGRDREIVHIRHLLATTRVLTLTGSGGIGKTRLAIHVAADVRELFRDGVYFVPLAAIREPALIIPTIAQALGVREGDGQTLLERLNTYLEQKQLLLLLDNMEQVLPAAPQLAQVLAATVHLKLLVTSREALHLSGEQVFPVPPLALPEPGQSQLPDAAQQAEAVELFVARARAVMPEFTMIEVNAAAVAAICRQLDGLPLAIELAAARVRLLPPTALLARLDKRLALLTRGPSDGPARHRTLRDAIAWSEGLLHDAEQRLLWRLAVFAGGFTLEAAESVAPELRMKNEAWRKASQDQAILNSQFSILNLLQSLIDKSLVKPPENAEGEPRFTMLETIREYALERLTQQGATQVAQDSHAAYFLALAERAAPELHGSDQMMWLARLDTDHTNLRVALDWLMTAGDTARTLRMIGALHWFWFVRGHFGEGRGWIDRALAMVDTAMDSQAVAPPLVAQARFAAGLLALFQGDLTVARAQLEASIAAWRALGQAGKGSREARLGLNEALTFLVVTCNLQGDAATAAAVIPESVALVHDLDDPRVQALLAFNIGRGLLLEHGQVAAAKVHLLEALARLRTLGDLWYIAQVTIDLGLVALWESDGGVAQGYYAEGLALARALQDRALEALAHNNLGEAARLVDDDLQAADYYATSLRLYRDVGSQSEIPRLLHNQGYLALHDGDLSCARARFSESLTIFRATGRWRGIAEALAGLAAVAAHIRTPNQAQRAARLWGAAEAVRQTVGTPIWPTDAREHDRYQTIVRTQVGGAAFAAAWAQGRAMPLDDAIALALAEVPAASGVSASAEPLSIAASDILLPDGPDALTAREVEVLRLVATGLSNQDVAALLTLSTYTVQNHLRNIYGKLGVSSRSAATRYAWEHRLLAREPHPPAGAAARTF
jgi:predicted ATPase/DNA-binding CsgD family transcriptional regulator